MVGDGHHLQAVRAAESSSVLPDGTHRERKGEVTAQEQVPPCYQANSSYLEA